MTPRYDPHRPVAVAAKRSLNNGEANVDRSDLEWPIQPTGNGRDDFGRAAGFWFFHLKSIFLFLYGFITCSQRVDFVAWRKPVIQS